MMILLIEIINQRDGSFEGALSLFCLVLHHSGGLTRDKTDLMFIGFLGSCLSEGTSKDVSVFLLWEVYIIVPMWVRILSWIISIILPSGVASQVLWMTILPALDIEIAN
jgi:hypothetical protein